MIVTGQGNSKFICGAAFKGVYQVAVLQEQRLCTGHAQADMITRVYAHILDEDRKVNAQKFESAFYANPDLRTVKAPAEPQQPALDLSALAAQLQQSSEFFQAFAGLISKQSC